MSEPAHVECSCPKCRYQRELAVWHEESKRSRERSDRVFNGALGGLVLGGGVWYFMSVLNAALQDTLQVYVDPSFGAPLGFTLCVVISAYGGWWAWRKSS